MIEQTATIQNHQGIHCRPSAVIIKSAEGYPGEIQLVNAEGDEVPLSILGLIGLGLECGQTVTIRVSGPDEEARCSELHALFEKIYDYQPTE